MIHPITELDWDDLSEYAPAIVAAVTMPLSYSIADGIGLGFICYAAIKLLAGKPQQCPLAVYAIAIIFALKFALL